MTNKELAELLKKMDGIRRAAPLVNDAMDSVVRLIKGELFRKKARQTGPAIGQTYWFAHIDYADSYTYTAGYFDLDISKYTRIYPEERFAEAELKAKKLIQAVNRRRIELNEGKEFVGRKFYIGFTGLYGFDVWGQLDQAYTLGDAYPFGLFKNSADCEMCIHEFKGELNWFYQVYLPLMAELDDYDWADAPGWGE